MKVLLNGFHFSGHTLEFHPQTYVSTTLYMLINSTTWKIWSIVFILVFHQGFIHTQVETAIELRYRVVYPAIHNLLSCFLQKQFTKMANTKLKKKKKGVIANGLNNDAGTNDRQVWDLLQSGGVQNPWSKFWLFMCDSYHRRLLWYGEFWFIRQIRDLKNHELARWPASCQRGCLIGKALHRYPKGHALKSCSSVVIFTTAFIWNDLSYPYILLQSWNTRSVTLLLSIGSVKRSVRSRGQSLRFKTILELNWSQN